ncbi:LysR family transcriptional regulator [Pseudogracilibacillus sp. SO30301A]|uniref:LysR family transcriptional regulator n=1 Tax=Pseudogracilibacillus sp. SO30301A TaxID=3098291 RepID=UPI00300E482D
MDIRHLEYFIEVAKHLNFTKAATALHVSQPSLSKTIKGIEEELGVPLFYRSFRQLEMTDAGNALLQNAKHVLHAYENLTSELNDVMELKKGEIKIGIPPIIGAAFCAKIISRYIDLFPMIDVSLSEVGSKKIKSGVCDGTLDIGFVCNKPLNKKEVDIMQIVKDPLMLVVHKQHALIEKSEISVKNIEDESFIMYRQDFSLFDSIIDACSQYGFYPNIVCESSQKDFILEMVEAKLGVALLPSQICNKINNKNIVAIPFEKPDIHLELGMIWKKNNYLPFSVREFVTVAKEFDF